MEKREKLRRNLLALCEGAIMIALAEILSLIPFYKYPWGGSVDLAMLPVILFCVRWGFGPAMLCSSAHAIFQFLLGGGMSLSWESIIGDYLLAYVVLGVAGLFRNRFYLGAIVACVARFAVHYVVGATVWGEYMPEVFFNMTMTTPWIYSALYNGAYMLPDLVMVLLAYFLLSKTPLQRYLKK